VSPRDVDGKNYHPEDEESDEHSVVSFFELQQTRYFDKEFLPSFLRRQNALPYNSGTSKPCGGSHKSESRELSRQDQHPETN
jgi:hypothetical protein